jgi:hypothetical protein
MLDEIEKPEKPGLISKLYSEAAAAYGADCLSRLVKPATVISYTGTPKALEKFLESEKILYVDEITAAHLRAYRVHRTQVGGSNPSRGSKF